MTDKIERREILTKLNIRENADNKREIYGKAIPFDSPSLPIWGDFIEYIAPDAFDESLNSDAEIMLLYAHDWSAPLARRSAGRLKLEKREDGIYFSATPPDTTRAQDLLKDIEAGNVKGNSFGFTVEADEWSTDENGRQIRRVLKGTLYEISAVVDPAYPDTTLAKRSLAASQKTQDADAVKHNLRKAHLRLLQAKRKIKNK